MTPIRTLYAAYPRPFWLLCLGTLINRTGEFVVPLLGFYLTAQQHMDVGQVSVILSALGVGRFVAESLGGQLSDRHGTAFTMKLALTGGAFMLLLLAQAHTFGQLFADVLAYSLLTAMYKPAASTAVADLTQGPQRAQAYNLLYWAINVGASIAPVLGGVLAGLNAKLLFYLDALSMLIYSAILALFYRVPKIAHLATHVLAVTIWTLGEIVAYSISKTIISELAAPHSRGSYIGLVGSMSCLATLIAPLLGGYLLKHYGATPMWIGIGSLGFLAAGLYLWLEGRVQGRRAEMAVLGA